MFVKKCQAIPKIYQLSPFETVFGSLIRSVEFPSFRQPSDITVCTNSENLSTEKPNKFLESLDILYQTFDTLERFERIFRRKLRENL